LFVRTEQREIDDNRRKTVESRPWRVISLAAASAVDPLVTRSTEPRRKAAPSARSARSNDHPPELPERAPKGGGSTHATILTHDRVEMFFDVAEIES
jgi:hypothetical protein